MTKILLTSFQTWLPHQVTNSSDDLLDHLEKQTFKQLFPTFLRQLPVDISLASQQAIAAINDIQPQVVICCGMAESRQQLTLESHARGQKDKLYTTINLEKLVLKLSNTSISYDAGKFVCEGLYYQVLHHLRNSHPNSHGLFVHVPVLTEINLYHIINDCNLILEELRKVVK